jgi:hypothetical protein
MRTGQVFVQIAAPLTVLLLAYIAVSIRKAVRRFMTEHRWLMTTVARQQDDIERMLKILETRSSRPQARRNG